MRLVIVTGMSGAGKSTALKMLEDAGYFCIDNLPIPLMRELGRFTRENIPEGVQKVAVGVDIRSGQNLNQLEKVLESMTIANIEYEILFLEAEDDVLVKRYKETRRSHPLSGRGGRIKAGIGQEREALAFMKECADYIIDTSHLLTRELKGELEKIFIENQGFNNLIISILSFGFKYGIPDESDLVFDVRFLPNPYYVEELKELSGEDEPVSEFVMGFAPAKEFSDKLEDMMRFLIPNYILEGKHQLVVSIGCTGGKHRSVTLAKELYNRLQNLDEFSVRIEHRDIGKDSIRKK